MGVGAIIGAVGSVVGAGIGAASNAGLFGGGGGGVTGSKVKLQGIDLPAYESGLTGYTNESTFLPGMAQTASQADTLSNQAYQAALGSVDPSLMESISSIGSIAQSYLGGQIPQDVQDQIQRATAQQSLQGGYGGTQMARNLTSRDLGLTSLNLQQLGSTMAGQGLNMAKGVTPSFTPVSSLMFTPAQLTARADQAAYYNTDIKNQQAVMNSGNALAAQVYAAQQQANQQKGLTSGINSGISSLFGSSSSSSSGGLLGSIMKLFQPSGSGGGGGGSGDGGGYDLNTISGTLGYLGLS